MSGDRDEQFEQFVRERRPALLRAATALAGGDAHLAEDLVQSTLVQLYLRWPRVRGMNVEAYARRVLVNSLIDHRRRLPQRRERSVGEVPELPTTAAAEVTDDAVLSALATLPPRMRAAVVLRYVEGLSVDETADALRCSAGNVKSQAARGLDKLRRSLEHSHAVIGTKQSSSSRFS